MTKTRLVYEVYARTKGTIERIGVFEHQEAAGYIVAVLRCYAAKWTFEIVETEVRK